MRLFGFHRPTADQQSLDAPVGEAPRTNRALSILKDLRVFRIFIAFWNALVMALMILYVRAVEARESFRSAFMDSRFECVLVTVCLTDGRWFSN